MLNNVPDNRTLFKKSVLSGFAWAIGVALGFAFVSTVVLFSLRNLNGLPLVGSLIADIVQSTQQNLENKTPLAQ